jgi:hypothetical protein
MKRLLYIALSFVAVAFVACNKDTEIGEVDLGYLKLVSSDVSFGYDGGVGQIVVDTTSPVTATVAANGDWISASVIGRTVIVTAPGYSGVMARNTSITVSADGRSVVVPVSQTSFGVVLASNSAAVPKEGGQLKVNYTIQTPSGIEPASFAGFEVVVVSDKPWVTGTIDGDQMTLTVEAYTDYLNPRSALVTLEGKDGTLAPRFTVTQNGPSILDLTRAQLNAMTWTVFANGEYDCALMTQPVARTLSTAGNGLFRIDSPVAANQHFYFAWDSENEGNYLLPAKDFVVDGYPTQSTGAPLAAGIVLWATDPDPKYTYYDAATKTFTINSNYLALNTSTMSISADYGWLDDYFTITE